MNRPAPNSLGLSLTRFFQTYLPSLRGMSTHTIRSYRDAIVLYLQFVASQTGQPPDQIDLDGFTAQLVTEFVTFLEHKRGNRVGTRNARLAAIHTFARFAAAEHPGQMAEMQRILSVPFKRHAQREPVEYLEQAEVAALLKMPTHPTVSDRRDHALFALMFNTGARVQEVLDLRVRDVRVEPPCQVRLQGKGGKVRICPIWAQTAEKLRPLMEQASATADPDSPLFVNRSGRKLTRFGVRYILRKRMEACTESIDPERAKHFHPHTLRHTTAIHLLRAGVDFVTISQWLGHSSLNTTMLYARADIDLKRQALAQVFPDILAPHSLPRNPQEGLEVIDWLRRL
jgi:site-specific recombinase XerD